MTASVWTWLAVAGVLAVLDWAAVARRARRWERCAKPAVLVCLLVAAALANPRHPHVQGWTIAALGFGLLGDLALVFQPQPEPAAAPALVNAGRGGSSPSPAAGPTEPLRPPTIRQGEPLFLIGLLSFLLGHLCYLIAMLRFGIDRLSVGFGMILVLIALFAFGYKIIASAHAAGGSLLTVGVTAYIAALGSAVVLGVGTTQLPIAYGIVLFAASDLILANDRFVQRRSWSALAVITTYHAAQALLLIGLLR
jgi:uncharacterized membrane protein YhhN